MYCKSYSEQYGLDCTIMRFGIPFGPRARAAAVVPAFVKKALAGEPLTIAGDGSQGRRFVYVEDLAEGTVRGLEPHAANRVYNLVGDETVTVKEIASIVRDIVGDVDILHIESRAGDFSGTEVSGARAARELDWVATTPFVEGVRRYIEWLRPAHRRRSTPAMSIRTQIPSAESPARRAPRESAGRPRRCARASRRAVPVGVM